MPDTMIQTADAPISVSSACGVLSDYRSPLIGQLVAARSRAAADIKRVIKDKTADIPNKQGGRGFSYSYADLASVMEAVDDALAAQEMALFQTIQERGRSAVLVTTLAHSSDQWISSEVRIASPDAGPQVFGSSLTYMRRYSALAILGIAPDNDDDGAVAQDRADQQARQQPVQRSEQPRRTQTAPRQPQATQEAPSADDPEHLWIEEGPSGLLLGRWVNRAKELLAGLSEEGRLDWLERHGVELDEVGRLRPDWVKKLRGEPDEPDLSQAAE